MADAVPGSCCFFLLILLLHVPQPGTHKLKYAGKESHKSVRVSYSACIFKRRSAFISGQLVSGRIFQHNNFSACLLSHQNTEQPELEANHEDHQIQLLAPCSNTQNPDPTSVSVVQMLLEPPADLALCCPAEPVYQQMGLMGLYEQVVTREKWRLLLVFPLIWCYYMVA